MIARLSKWERERAALLRIEYPVEPGVLDAVAALRLLGFPTVGSCEGHFLEETGDIGEPYIGIGWELPARFLAGVHLGDSIYDDPRRGSSRERHYLALLGWRVYRPMTHTLARLAVSWAAEDAGREPFVFNAGWWGISITHASSRDACHASAEASAPAILAARQAFESFGEWLRERYLAGELERQRFRRRALPK